MILVLCIDDCKIKGRSSILALKFKNMMFLIFQNINQ